MEARMPGQAQGSGANPIVNLYRAMSDLVLDPATGVDKPHAVVRLMVLDAMKQFQRLTGRPPRLLYVPRCVEAALQIDRGRNLGLHEDTHGKIRDEQQVFTCRVVW